MTTHEAIERVEAMVDDTTGQTWDHSPKDIEALRIVLEILKRRIKTSKSED